VNNKSVWKSFITSVIILAGSFLFGIVYFPASWGLSLPLAIYYIPLLYFIVRLFSLFSIKDVLTRKSVALGILGGALLWAGTCSYFITVPSQFQYVFRLTFPGLRQSDLDHDGQLIADATKGKYVASDLTDGKMFFELIGWRQMIAELRGGDLLEITGYTSDSLPSFDSLLVTRRVQQLVENILNENGKRVMAYGKWEQQPSRERNSQTGAPQMINVTLIDSTNKILLAHVPIGQYIALRLQKDYSILAD
jgi:hypothetical protein